MDPEAFAALIGALPPGSSTVRDLLTTLDAAAHRAEEADEWWDAAHIRQTHAEVLRFIQRGIEGGAVDVAAAVAVTRRRLEGMDDGNNHPTGV